MEQDLRDELNRMWVELRALQSFTAMFASRHFTREEIEQWNGRMVEHFEEREEFSEGYRANMVRALDDLGRILRETRDGFAPPPAK